MFQQFIVLQVPDAVNNQLRLTKHFSRYGTVTKVTPNMRKKTAIIHFSEHKSAKLAKEKGKVLNPMVPPIGHIFYSQISPGKGRIRRTTSKSEVIILLTIMFFNILCKTKVLTVFCCQINSEAESESVRVKALFSSLPLKKKTFSITKALTSSGILQFTMLYSF